MLDTAFLVKKLCCCKCSAFMTCIVSLFGLQMVFKHVAECSLRLHYAYEVAARTVSCALV